MIYFRILVKLFVGKLIGMEIVYDGDCKAFVPGTIIIEVCRSAMEMGNIFVSCDPKKTSRDV